MTYPYPKLFAALFVACAAFACQDSSDSGDPPEPEPSAGRPTLRAGERLDEAPSCGVDLPACAAGLECATVDTDGAPATAACVDAVAVCAKLECARGSCGILESYPARITCVGGG
ncbi:MAG TPA: hypothetical protein VFS00_33050 [Polyangiaceae bacterium]|nr:hypothetical protein [Polyangiaceae bacterium]